MPRQKIRERDDNKTIQKAQAVQARAEPTEEIKLSTVNIVEYIVMYELHRLMYL